MERDEKLKKLREYGLIVRATQTNPSKAGKKPKDIWEILGVNVKKYEHILRDEMELKKWKGTFTAWEDPVDTLLSCVEDAKELSVGEIQEYAASRSESRADRLADRAHKQYQERDRRYQASNEIAERFHGGQPILVGHHSEGRARRDKAKIHNHMDKSISAGNYGDHLSSRAAGALNNAAMKTEYTLKYAGNRLKEAEAELRAVERAFLPRVSRNFKYIGENPEFKGQWIYVTAVSKDHSTVNLHREVKLESGGWDYPKLNNVPVSDLEIVSATERIDLENRRKNAEEAIAYWTEQVNQLGGQKFNKDTIKKGDFINRGFGLQEVVRVNAKSVSVKTQYSWTDTVPYTKIKAHFTAAQVAAAKAKQEAQKSEEATGQTTTA